MIALVGVLALSAAGYLRYMHTVPPFVPRLPPMPEPNGYEQAAALALRMPHSPGVVGWPDWTPELLPAQLAPIRPLLNDARATFRLQWRKRPPLSVAEAVSSTERNKLVAFRTCARWFAAESALARSQGDYGTAMQRALDAVELGSKTTRGGGLTDRLVGGACHAIGFGQVEKVVPLLPASAIPQALDRVRRVRQQWPPVSEMLATERTTVHLILTEVFREENAWVLQDPDAPEPSFWDAMAMRLTPRRTVVENMDRYYLLLIAQSGKPVRQRVLVPIPPDPWSRRLVPTFTYQLDDAWKLEGMDTELALLEVALAARMYYLEHGRYPDRLSEVARRWLPAVPGDLWGQPVAYHMRAGEPVIYSLGPDGKDQGGQAVNPYGLTPTTQGDLVFGKLSSTAWRHRKYAPR